MFVVVFFRDEDSSDAMDIKRTMPKQKNNNVVEKPSDFQSRMKNIIVKQNKTPQGRNRNLYRPKNVKSAVSLEEFASVIEEGRRDDKVIVVRFYATWCKVIFIMLLPSTLLPTKVQCSFLF